MKKNSFLKLKKTSKI